MDSVEGAKVAAQLGEVCKSFIEVSSYNEEGVHDLVQLICYAGCKALRGEDVPPYNTTQGWKVPPHSVPHNTAGSHRHLTAQRVDKYMAAMSSHLAQTTHEVSPLGRRIPP